MNVPFVKVNNQQEFDRVVDKMEKETGFKLHESSKCGADSIFNVIGIDSDSDILLYDPSHDDNKHLKIISADEYLTGIKENFTLSDLEDGMVVELRGYYDESFFLVLFNKILGLDSFDDLEEYNEDFTTRNSELDIVKIYSIVDIKSLSTNLSKDNLTLIFDAEAHRNKSKISQRKLEIKNEIEKLEKELKSLEVK